MAKLTDAKQNEYLNFQLDVDGETARLVIDTLTHNKLDQAVAIKELKVMLGGTLPRSAYDSFSTEIVGSDYFFTFRYNNVRQFVITITDPGGLPSGSVEEINNRLLEDGAVRLLEDGGERLLED